MAVTPTQVEQILNLAAQRQGGQPFGGGGAGVLQQTPDPSIPDIPPDFDPNNPPINPYGGVGTGPEGPRR